MANIAVFESGRVPQYFVSVNGAEYYVDPTASVPVARDSWVLINPDVSALTRVPLKHWKQSGSRIVEMSAAEKAVVLAAEVAARDAEIDKLNVEASTLAKALVQLRLVTQADLATAIKAVI
jgi:hypothetical protein